MSKPPVNIYPVVVYDLNKRVKAYIDELNNSNQIDLDVDGHPYLLSSNNNGPNYIVHIVRNGRDENFLINTRKRQPPITSWNPDDGFHRSGGKKVIMVTSEPEGSRRERGKRTIESFTHITDQILGE